VDTRIGEILKAIASNVSMASYATVEEGIRDVSGAAVAFTMNNKKTLSAIVGKIRRRPGFHPSRAEQGQLRLWRDGDADGAGGRRIVLLGLERRGLRYGA
jgi:hypothetical protein